MSVAEQQADEQHRRLEQLKSSVQNRVQVFGRGYAELVRKIEAADRQRKFRRRPVGPLGEACVLLHLRGCVLCAPVLTT